MEEVVWLLSAEDKIVTKILANAPWCRAEGWGENLTQQPAKDVP